METYIVYLFPNRNVMGAKRPKLLPIEKRILEHLGENIKLARLRRKLTTEQIANRANISRKTLSRDLQDMIEKGLIKAVGVKKSVYYVFR